MVPVTIMPVKPAMVASCMLSEKSAALLQSSLACHVTLPNDDASPHHQKSHADGGQQLDPYSVL